MPPLYALNDSWSYRIRRQPANPAASFQKNLRGAGTILESTAPRTNPACGRRVGRKHEVIGEKTVWLAGERPRRKTLLAGWEEKD